MKVQTLPLGFVLVSFGNFAVEAFSCNGPIWGTQNYCCVSGSFVGPVVSSFSSHLSAALPTTKPVPTPHVPTPAKAVRAAQSTSEVSPGLTCIGDSVTSSDGNGHSSNPTGTTAVSGSGTVVSNNNAAMITQAPILVAGAAAVLAYGGM